jgi:protein HIRA/HIR1
MIGLSKPPEPLTKQTLDANIELRSFETAAQNQVICTLEYHQNPVNCLKFSPNGRMLAACSDDFTVSVYHCPTLLDRRHIPPSSQSNSFNKNLEDWNFYKLFRKHNKDVLGVAWSSDSKYLASCSVDNTVLVYDIVSAGVFRINYY